MSGEKTEQPSPKKLRQAREDGNVPKSKDFSSALTFFVGAAVISATAPDIIFQMQAFARRCFSAGSEPPGRLLSLCLEIAREGMILTLMLVMPLLGALVLLNLVIGFGQTGGLFTVKALAFKIEKLNPVEGMKNTFFSARAYVELLKSLLKLGVAGILGYMVMRDAIREVCLTQRIRIEYGVLLSWDLVGELVRKIGGFMVIVGVFDFFYQRYQWNKGLMMSKQEMKDEYKQSEGDPQMKGKRKQMAKEMQNQKGVQSVKQAKVVVTNPHEIAVALEYLPEEGQSAPQVLCKGERLIAQQIIAEAEKHGVPIMRNVALAHSLNELEAGDEVPEDLYDAVAEVLNWVYALAAGEELGAVEEQPVDDW